MVINIFLKELNFKLHPFFFVVLKIYLARAVHKYFILITRRDCFSAGPKGKGGRGQSERYNKEIKDKESLIRK